MSIACKDLRCLSAEQRDRVRFGESPPITDPDRRITIICCGLPMVYNNDTKMFYCQNCGELHQPPLLSTAIQPSNLDQNP